MPELAQTVGAHVVGRHFDKDDWQEVARDVILACRRSDYDVLVVINEAHGIAPECEGYLGNSLDEKYIRFKCIWAE